VNPIAALQVVMWHFTIF